MHTVHIVGARYMSSKMRCMTRRLIEAQHMTARNCTGMVAHDYTMHIDWTLMNGSARLVDATNGCTWA